MAPAGRFRWPNGRRFRPGAIALTVLAALSLVLVFAPTVGPRFESTTALRIRGTDTWVTSWSASPQPAIRGTRSARGFAGQTVRDIIWPSAGGNQIRLELSNAYGHTPLTVGRVTVAVAGQGAALAGRVYPVTFDGSSSVQIPAGAQLLSDPVDMSVAAMRDLAVSIYLPGRTGPATFHADALQVNWVSGAGDDTTEETGGSYPSPDPSWYYLSGLVVRSPTATGTVAALGDSITDGVNSSIGVNGRWPNDLARLLDAQVGGPHLAVADEGIGGNRVLAASPRYGASAEQRFARDVLDVPGVRDVIVAEGINDLGFGDGRGVSVARLEAGYRQLIAGAHARGLKIFGATLLPFQGAGYYTAAGEAKRVALNTWIRTSGAFDAVIDFAAVMADPSDPIRLNPAYDSGDHLHPNDAGYEAMAAAINLQLLTAP